MQRDEELVRDFHSADNVTGALHFWWLGHSGFLVKWNGQGILFDPYLTDSVTRKHAGTGRPRRQLTGTVVDPLLLSGVDVVAISNFDEDHFDAETILALRSANPQLRVVLPSGLVEKARDLLGPSAPGLVAIDSGAYVDCSAFEINGIHAANPNVETGDSLDLGYVVCFGPFAVYHSGDTQWHDTLVREVRRWTVNLAFLPINGGSGEGVAEEESGTAISGSGIELEERSRGDNLSGFESAALAKAISTGLAVPCHYNMFDGQAVDTKEFATCCERLRQPHQVLQPGQRITMGPVEDPGAGEALPTEKQGTGWDLGY